MNEFLNPGVLAMNVIRYLGDSVKRFGIPIPRLQTIGRETGAPSEVLASELVKELEDRGLVRLGDALTTIDGSSTFQRKPALPHGCPQPSSRHRHLLKYRRSRRGRQTAKTRRANGQA